MFDTIDWYCDIKGSQKFSRCQIKMVGLSCLVNILYNIQSLDIIICHFAPKGNQFYPFRVESFLEGNIISLDESDLP